MNYLLLSIIVVTGLLTFGISFGQTHSINCDGDTITYNISKIIIYSCKNFYMGGSVYTAPVNSIYLETNGEGGNLELKIPKSLMDEIYVVSRSDESTIHLPFQKSSESSYNVVSIEIPDKVNLITIDGDQPHHEITNGGAIIAAILIGGGITVLAIATKKWKFGDLRK